MFTKFVNVLINIKENTLITTYVMLLSTQKNVSDLRAYCSENLRIISTDLSDGSAEKKTKITELNKQLYKRILRITVPK